MVRPYALRGLDGWLSDLAARRIVEPKGTPVPAPTRKVPPGATQRGGPVILRGDPPVKIHVSGSELNEPGRVRLVRFRISDEVSTVHPSMPKNPAGEGRKNILAGENGWLLRARNNDGDPSIGLPSTAKRISRVFSRIPSSAKIWLSPRIENKSDPLRTPRAYVVYGLTTGFIPFIKDDCLMPLLRGGAAIGLEFEVFSEPGKSGVLPIEEILGVAAEFNPEEPSCSLVAERGFSFERAASVLKFQNRLEAIAAGPANLYNAYLNVITSDERAHEAYHRILFEKFLRQKRLAPRAMNAKLDKELNRRANMLQAHRLFVFMPDGSPIALNRSLLEEYGLSIDRVNKLRADSSGWGRWVIQEVLGMNYDNYMSRLRSLKLSRQGQDEETGSPSEQESVFEFNRREVEGVLAGYFSIV